MRVDFYQVGQDPVPEIVALLARNTLKAGERLLVVGEPDDLLDAIGEALWRAAPADSFLANGRTDQPHAARQPVLLSNRLDPANGARFCVLADGIWREPEGFERTFLVFDAATLDAARACWRMLGEREGLERHFWRQEGGRWVKAG
ncbi:DNA polymerase III subunit chi [Novosphingobium piscinae]|uniref:DNA polymerase III subunit chi n=1 Tax=Novosphingobium piscinae TaxID=1507448 RepID=A0A7X1KPN1_9SPHN|nr:DNA polymerase III subunit chi [Novosphingobium piscinae]MBC2668894.1 DNA polymerase III subunit chi [Novosphingobium piscinae]